MLVQSENVEGSSTFESVLNSPERDLSPAVAAAAASSGMSSPRYKSIHPDSPTATCGKFFETLTASSLYKNTKVKEMTLFVCSL